MTMWDGGGAGLLAGAVEIGRYLGDEELGAVRGLPLLRSAAVWSLMSCQSGSIVCFVARRILAGRAGRGSVVVSRTGRRWLLCRFSLSLLSLSQQSVPLLVVVDGVLILVVFGWTGWGRGIVAPWRPRGGNLHCCRGAGLLVSAVTAGILS